MNLEQQKKQARELLRAIRSGDADAFSRLQRHHARWAAFDESAVRQLVSLHDAQFVLAREQGFASWPKLKAYAEPSSRSRHTRLFVADVSLDHGPCSRLAANARFGRPGSAGTNSRMAPAVFRSERRGDSASSLHRGRCPPGLRKGARLRNLGRPDDPGEPPRLEPRHSSQRTVHGRLRRTAGRAMLPASKPCCALIRAWPASAGQMATRC